jgi:hypothetical protein
VPATLNAWAADLSAEFPEIAASDVTAIARYYKVVFATRLPGETPLLVIGRDGFVLDLIMVLAAGQR